MQVRSLDQGDPLEKDMATHSSILAWRIPWTEEPGGLQFMGLQSQTRLSIVHSLSPVQLSVTPMDCSRPGFPVLHHLLELAQTHIY